MFDPAPLTRVLTDIQEERQTQDEKWGVQNHDHAEWMLILSEEVGEAAKEANEAFFREANTTHLRKELIQAAAVCVAYVEYLDRLLIAEESGDLQATFPGSSAW